MSWTDLAPAAKTYPVRSDVTISMHVSPRYGTRVRITLRPSAFPDCKWLKAGNGVRLSVGSGEHAGMVRIAPGGLMKLSHNTGRSKDKVALTSKELAALLPAGNHLAAPCEFDFQANWIEFTLPAWARPARPERPAPFAIPGKIPASPAAGHPIPMGGRT